MFHLRELHLANMDIQNHKILSIFSGSYTDFPLCWQKIDSLFQVYRTPNTRTGPWSQYQRKVRHGAQVNTQTLMKPLYLFSIPRDEVLQIVMKSLKMSKQLFTWFRFFKPFELGTVGSASLRIKNTTHSWFLDKHASKERTSVSSMHLTLF